MDTLYAVLRKVLKRWKMFPTGSKGSIGFHNISLCTVVPQDNIAPTIIFSPMFGFLVTVVRTSASSCISVIWEYFSEISNSALLFHRALSGTDKKSAIFTQEKPIKCSPSICSEVCHKQDNRVSLYTAFFYPRKSILSVLNMASPSYKSRYQLL